MGREGSAARAAASGTGDRSWTGWLRTALVFTVLVAAKVVTHCFYRFQLIWIDGEPADAWKRMRMICFLHHTSLFDVLYIGALPVKVLWAMSRRGVAPAADKSLQRPILGKLLGMMMYRVVSITRKRDETWAELLSEIDPEAIVLLAPEGRMMRSNGLDLKGRPMTVRGGVADVLPALSEGNLVLTYSQGMHHVQAPGERLPRIFRRITAKLQQVEVSAYCQDRRAEADRLISEGGVDPEEAFKLAVIRDLEARRDRNCPVPDPADVSAALAERGSTVDDCAARERNPP